MDRQQTALFLIGQWEAEASPEAPERLARAVRIASTAEIAAGSPLERIAQLEAAMRQVTAIAQETADESEQRAILALNEPLTMLADSWRPEASG